MWFVCDMFAFLNLPIAGGLTKLAYRKIIHQHSRYAILLVGVAACASAAVGLIFEAILGNTTLAGIHGQSVLYYTLSVWIIAMPTLPKQLTRAPEQSIVFRKMKR